MAGDVNIDKVIKDIQQEIADLRKLRDQYRKEYEQADLQDSRGGGAIYTINVAINKKVKELARLEIKKIENINKVFRY